MGIDFLLNQDTAHGRTFDKRCQYLFHQSARTELLSFRKCTAFIGTGKGQHILHQSIQTDGLAADAAAPFIFTQMELHGIHIGADDGQRCFEFMSGIGNELLLLFDTFRHGTNGTMGQQNDDSQHQYPGSNADNRRQKHNGKDLLLLVFKRQKDKGSTRRLPQSIITEAVKDSADNTQFKNTIYIFGGRFPIHRRNMIETDISNNTVLIHFRQKITGSIDGITADRTKKLIDRTQHSLFFLFLFMIGTAIIVQQNVKYLLALPPRQVDVGSIDGQQYTDKQYGDDQHSCRDKLMLQFTGHACSTSSI